MTSQKAQIQALIKEIDAVLSKPIVRLPWVNYAGFDQQRRVLEQTREFLASLEQQMTTLEGFGVTGGAGNLLAFGVQPPSARFPSPQPSAATESAQQVLQAVLQEMSYLRTNVMQTLRGDVEVLQQQREALAQEIRLLEAQRQQYALPQQQAAQQQMISDFLQSLMGRLQENLTGQVAQMLVNLEAETAYERSLAGSPEGSLPGTANYQPLLAPSQRLEHLQRVQSQSDQLLLKLDSTLRVIFESLQTNMQSYEESLGRGLDKMHSLGQQGEAMFTALVNRLAQQLGRDASAYLQSSLQPGAWDPTAPSLPPPDLTAGIGMIPGQPAPQSGVTDAQIDRLMNQGDTTPPVSDAGSLNALNQDLNRLNLDTTPPIFELPDDDDLTFFQVDEPAEPLPKTHASEPEELTTLQINEEITRIQSELEGVGQEEQLDSALDLLNHLGVSTTPSVKSQEAADKGADAPADGSYDELDGLYESMFGGSENEPLSEANEELMLLDTPESSSETDSIMTAFAPEDIELFDETSTANLEETTADQATADVDLFDGLTDPVDGFGVEEAGEPQDEGVDSGEMLLTEMASNEVPDSVASSLESFLFDEPEPASEEFVEPSLQSTDLDFLGDQIFGEETPPGEPFIPEQDEEEQEEAITSLAELIGLSEPESESSFDLVPPELETVHDLQDDVFEPASPDETLLAGEDSSDESQIDLHLPDTTLTQLTADLSSLEGLSVEEFTLPDLPLSSQQDVEGFDQAQVDAFDLEDLGPEEPRFSDTKGSEQGILEIAPSDLEAALELSASEPLDDADLALTLESDLIEPTPTGNPGSSPAQDQDLSFEDDLGIDAMGLDALLGDMEGADETVPVDTLGTAVNLSEFNPAEFDFVSNDTFDQEALENPAPEQFDEGQDELMALDLFLENTPEASGLENPVETDEAPDESWQPTDSDVLWEEFADFKGIAPEETSELPPSLDDSEVAAWENPTNAVQELTLDDFLQAEPPPSPSTIDAGIDALFADDIGLGTPEFMPEMDTVASVDEMMEPSSSNLLNETDNAFIGELFGLDEPDPVTPPESELDLGLEDVDEPELSFSEAPVSSFTDEPLDVRTIEELLAFTPDEEAQLEAEVGGEPDLTLEELDAIDLDALELDTLNLETSGSISEDLGEEFPPTLAALFSTEESEALFEEDPSLSNTSDAPDWTLESFAQDVPELSQPQSEFPNLVAEASGVETDANAFTLEGLESLFEDIPDVGSSEVPAPDQRGDGMEDWTLEGAFGNLNPEERSTPSGEGEGSSSETNPSVPEDPERNWF